jgi:ribosomal protein S18 acetylase RimI-like enzyme
MRETNGIRIAMFEDADLDALVALALRAWAPVFESIAATLGAELFREQYPDWRLTQRNAVVSACRGSDMRVLVARAGDHAAGFAALKLHAPDRMGEVHMIAVDPAWQRRGVARELMAHGTSYYKEAGMTTAMVETGGDIGHAPAREFYEAQGFTAFPAVRYFRKL